MGSYHISLISLDGASTGSQDNQVKGADVLVPNLCISGTKTRDCDGAAVEGITINLLDDTDTIIDTTTTDANGDSPFCDLPPGDYTVEEVLPGGWQEIEHLTR